MILSIDDDPDVLSLISQEMEEGFQVVGVTRALEGIEKAKQLGPHAITVDIMMPGMDGWEAISRLKQDPATRDIPLVVELVTQLLEEDSWTVRSAGNGRQALDEIARKKPDVLLLDLMMPIMDGFEVLKTLREDPANADLPIIIITAKELAGDEREALRQGSARIIEKNGLDRESLMRELLGDLFCERFACCATMPCATKPPANTSICINPSLTSTKKLAIIAKKLHIHK